MIRIVLVILLFRDLRFDFILNPVLFSVKQDVTGIGICFGVFLDKVMSGERNHLAVEIPRSINNLLIIRQSMIRQCLNFFCGLIKA